jgi:dihydroneopterin aldolase
VSVLVEIHGFEVFGHHGVDEAERRQGQPFVFDVELEVHEPVHDSIDAVVDYRAVRDVVRAVCETQQFQLLETLAAAVADALDDALQPRFLRVRVRKPGVAWADWTAATVERRSPTELF